MSRGFSPESFYAPDADMPPFIPGQCLFCPHSCPSFADSVAHMQKAHGLFVPDQQHLAVNPETLFQHLHLLIFGYRECIRCGTERSSVQAIQQHMTGKGHCTMDPADSEFAEFYFAETDSDDTDGLWSLRVDGDSICLPSGKIISKRSSMQTATPCPSHRRPRLLAAMEEAGRRWPQEQGDGSPERGEMSKRERRERAVVTYQAASLRAHDRKSLVHLPMAQQRALLAVQQRQASSVQKEEKRRRSRIDRKGNKNLYAYWATETPVYLCG